MAAQPPSTRKEKRSTRPEKRGTEYSSRIVACYNGCMLGFALSATVFRHYAREYTTHRQRILEFLAELGAEVRLPVLHKEFSANRDTIVEAVCAELRRVSPHCLGWTLFGYTAMWFAVKRAVRSPEAAELRRVCSYFNG